jgi:TorA maturation chaperone TorD|tara:strand:- start:198 stop:1427 length:1230 start_codon:yes stop_codon:yes gene_type:complete
MATQTYENIQRLPPFLEGLQKRMLQTGFGEFDGDTQTTPGLLDSPLGLPDYQMAGMDPLRTDAINLGEQLSGSYRPFIEGARDQSLAGQQALMAGLGTLQSSLDPLGRADAMVTGAEGITRGGLGDLASGRQAIGAGSDYLQQASNLADPSQGISQFMNPYQQNVIDSTMSQLDRQADIQRQGNAAKAIQAGAFGGSREGVQRAETDKNLQQVKSDTLAKLLSSNYSQALAGSQNAAKLQAGLGQASGDLGARYGSLGQTAGTLGTGVGQLGNTLGNIGNQYSTVAGRQGNIGQQFGTLAGTTSDIGRLQQAQGQADVSQLSQLGAMRQQQQQSQLDAQRQNQMQAAQEPYTRLQLGQNLLQGMPSASIPSTFTQATTPSANPFLQGIGAYTTLSQIAPFSGASSSGGS